MARLEPKFIIEAALMSADKPLTVPTLRRLFSDRVSSKTILGHLETLQEEWKLRGLRLVEVASGWEFVTAEAAQPYLVRLSDEKPPRYTRAALETLAIIAYRQPVTRGDIEDIRGVALNPQLLRQFEERGWIETVGYRETPGRPALIATTPQFLNDLGLKSLEGLPQLEEEVLPDFFLGDERPQDNYRAEDSAQTAPMVQKEINFEAE